jgi:hypothetical protein
MLFYKLTHTRNAQHKAVTQQQASFNHARIFNMLLFCTGLAAGTYTFMYVITKLSRFSISYDYGTFYYHQCYGDSFYVIALPTQSIGYYYCCLQVERERI